MNRFNAIWVNLASVPSKKYVCGYCGSSIASDKAFTANMANVIRPFVFICHECNRPTFLFGDEQTPGPIFGEDVDSLPSDIDKLYGEIRKAASAGAYTSAVMAARKLLMHIAVEKGEAKNKSFVDYVTFLEANHYTPPNSKAWVDKVRKLGNGANHKIVIFGPDETILILTFLEMLLKFIYEFPAASEQSTEI